MYEFFNKHFKLGFKSPIIEEDFVPLSREELTVWDGNHPKPKMDQEAERALLLNLARESDKQIAALTPKDEPSTEEFRKIVGGGWSVVIGRSLPDGDSIDVEIVREGQVGDTIYRLGYLTNPNQKESIPDDSSG